MASLIEIHGDRICALARYSLSHPEVMGNAGLDGNGRVVTSPGLRLPDTFAGYTRDILSTGSTYPVDIRFREYGTSVSVYLNGVPWDEVGSEREVLSYSPYTAFESLDTVGPSTHWKVLHDVGKPTLR
jgi:hypothetical protein